MPDPSSSAELTATWLSERLRAEIDSFTVLDIGVGVGIFGEIVRIVPTYRGAPGPASLIAKFATQEPSNLAVGLALNLYGREVGFYRDAAPSTPVRTPLCHYGAIGEDGCVVLLLEDLERDGDGGPGRRDLAGTGRASDRSARCAAHPLVGGARAVGVRVVALVRRRPVPRHRPRDLHGRARAVGTGLGRSRRDRRPSRSPTGSTVSSATS